MVIRRRLKMSCSFHTPSIIRQFAPVRPSGARGRMGDGHIVQKDEKPIRPMRVRAIARRHE
jgi:hypothetical protein